MIGQVSGESEKGRGRARFAAKQLAKLMLRRLGMAGALQLGGITEPEVAADREVGRQLDRIRHFPKRLGVFALAAPTAAQLPARNRMVRRERHRSLQLPVRFFRLLHPKERLSETKREIRIVGSQSFCPAERSGGLLRPAQLEQGVAP